MAIIKPLRAWRYNPSLIDQIDSLTSPLFDVISARQRQSLYQNHLNSIHLSVPDGENPGENAGRLLTQWKSDGVIIQDKLPGIYVHYQYFSLHGDNRIHCRKGFIANLKLADWQEQVVLRHENTMTFSVQDRIELLNSTQLNVSPTHGMYTDRSDEIEKYLDESIHHPIYQTEDYQGVKDVFGVIHDVPTILRIVKILSDKQIILADGHHRYEGSLEYAKKQKSINRDHTGKEAYNFHLMYLTNTEQDYPHIQPTHRLINRLEFDKSLLTKLESDFHVKEIDNVEDINDVILGKKWAFGLLIEDLAFKIRLKEEKIDEIQSRFEGISRIPDLIVLHHYVFFKLFGLSPEDQRSSHHITYQRNFAECLREVTNGRSQMAFITQEIPMESVKEICYSGYVLPQKSTYFYPKQICGFLFGSIKQDEFESPIDSSF